MRRLLTYILYCLLATSASTAVAAPLREVRAAWIATNFGLDWPRFETDPQLQREMLTDMLDRLADANFNTIYMQMQTGNGDVLWPSAFEPAAADVTGNGSMPLAWDVASFVVNEAHRRGLECVAVISPYALGTRASSMRYDANRVPHPIESMPDAIITDGTSYFLDPGNPATIGFLLSLYTELVSAYGFDGILVDSPLFPQEEVDDTSSFADFNFYDENRQSWRSGNLDKFIIDLYELIQRFNPSMKLLIATEGALDSDNYDSPLPEPDYRSLIEDGYVDFIVPKIFSRGSHGFAPTIENWTLEGDDNLAPHTIIALTPEMYLTSMEGKQPAPEIDKQVDMARDDDEIAGIALYRASFITNTSNPSINARYNTLRDNQFLFPAHLPETPTDNPTTPYAPENVTSTRDEFGNYVITWDEPPLDPRGTPIKYYTIYIALDGETDLTDPRGEIAHRVVGNSFLYPSPTPGLEFAVTAFDSNNRESLPTLSALPEDEDMYARPYVFRFYADNLYVAAPKSIERIEIYNLWGNKVKHLVVNDFEMNENCSDLKGGVYVVHTVYADGGNDVNKFIK